MKTLLRESLITLGCTALLAAAAPADEYVPFPLVWPRTPAEDAPFFFLDYEHIDNERYALRFFSYFSAPFVPRAWHRYVKCTFTGELGINTNYDRYETFVREQERRFKRVSRDMESIRDAIAALEADLRQAGNDEDGEQARLIREELQPLQELVDEFEDDPASLMDFDFYYRLESNLDGLRESEVWDEIEAEYDITGTTADIRAYADDITGTIAEVSDDLRNRDLDPFYARTAWELRFMVHWYYDRIPRRAWPARAHRWADRLRELL